MLVGGREYTVGVLVQANYGERATLRIAGVPVGREIPDLLPELAAEERPDAAPLGNDGSILVVVTTDAPVSQPTLKAMARRAALGLARNGATANPTSGDVVIAFATTSIEPDAEPPHLVHQAVLFPYAAKPLYAGVIGATEEAVVNALVAARSMTGRHGGHVHALPHDRLREVLDQYNRLEA